MAASNINLTFTFTPVFDANAFNTIITQIKSALGPLGNDIRPIDESKFAVPLRTIQQETDKATNALKQMGVQTDSTAKTGGILQKAFAFNQIAQSMTMITSATAPFVNSFIELDRQVKNIGSLGVENFQEFTALATELSTKIPEDAATIASGVYEALSAGITGTNQELINFAEVAAKAGVAGMSDTQSAVDGMTSVLNAYGLSAGAAGNVADTFFAGIKIGKTTFTEMNASIANFVPMASALGVGFDQGTAAIARLTSMGTPTSQAATQMNAVFTLLQKGTAPLNKALEKSGTSLEELRLKLKQNVSDGGGLVNVMKIIADSAVKSDSTVAALTGRVEAAKIIESLVGTQDKFNASMDTYKNVVKEVEAGAAVQAFNVASESIYSRVQGIMGSVQAVFNNAFMALGDGASVALSTMNQLAPSLMGFAALGTIIPPGVTTGISGFVSTLWTKLVPGLAATTAATTVTTTATTATGVAATTTSFSFSTMWAAATGPVGLVIAGVVAVGAAIWLLYEYVEPVKNAIDFLWDVITVGAEGVWSVITKGYEVFFAFGSAVLNYVTMPIQILWGVFSNIIDKINIFSGSAGSSIGIMDGMRNAFQVVIDVFNFGLAVIEGVNATISGFIGSMVQGISSLLSFDFSGAWDAFSGAGEEAKKNFDSGFGKSMDASSIDKMKTQLENAFGDGVEIAGKLNQAKSVEKMSVDLVELEKQIQPLQVKVSAGTASDEEKKQLDALQQRATDTANKLKEIAPQAVQGIKTWVDSQGALHSKYDISVTKAKEVAKSQTEMYSGDLSAKQKQYSDSLVNGLAVYEKTKAKLADLKAQMEKTNDPQIVKKLSAEYNDNREILTKNHAELIKGYEDGAKAGLLTKDATVKIEGAFNLTKGTAEKLKKVQEEMTAEAEETETAVSRIAGEFTKGQKELKDAYDESLNTYVSLVKSRKEGAKLSEEEKQALQDAQSTLSKNSAELRKADAIRKQASDTWKTTYEAQKKATVGILDHYEGLKKINAQELKSMELQIETARLAENREKSTKDELVAEENKYAKLQEQKLLLDKILAQYKLQVDEAGKLSGGVGISKDDLQKVQEAVYQNINDIKSSENVKKGISIKIITEAAKAQEELSKVNEEIENLRILSQKADLKYKFELGLIMPSTYESELLALQDSEIKKLKQEELDLKKKYDAEANELERARLNKQLVDINNLVLTKAKETETKKLEISRLKEEERINAIEDDLLREKELRTNEAQKTYDAELKSARGNNAVILQAFIKLQESKRKAELEYYTKSSSLAVQAATTIANAFVESYDKIFDSSSQQDKSTEDALKSLEAEEENLRKSYANREIDYREFQSKMDDLEQKRNEAKKAADINYWETANKALSEALKKTADIQLNAMMEQMEKQRILKERELTVEQQIEEQKRQIFAATLAGNLDAAQQYKDSLIKLENEKAEIQTASAAIEKGVLESKVLAYGTMFAALGAEQKKWGKAMLLTSLKVLKAEVPIAIADAIIKSYALSPLTGAFIAAGVTAIMYAALAPAEAAISQLGFRKGGLVPGGQQSITVNESGREFVLNAKATAVNLKDLEVINRNNYSIEDFVLKERPDIQQKLIGDALLRDRKNVIIQQEMLQSLVENDRQQKQQVNQQAKEENKELMREIVAMKEELKYLTKVTERGRFKLDLDVDSDALFKKAEMKRRSKANRM